MNKILAVFLLFINAHSYTQHLSLENVIELALEHNHNIIISRSEVQIAKNNNTYGNAGLLPTVDVNGEISISKSNVDILFANQPEPIENANAESYSEALSANLIYVLFSGFGNIRTYHKLNSIGELAEIQTRVNIESTLLSVVSSYYEVLKLQQQLKAKKYLLEISKQRLKRISVTSEYGATTKLNALNAQVDVNTDSSSFLSSIQDLNNAKNSLNFLLGNPMSTTISIAEDDNDLPEIKSLEEYENLSKKNNVNLLLSQMNVELNEWDKKINESRFSPIVAANLRYGYNSSESAPSVVLSNSSLGFTGSVNLIWNLFDGNKKRIALKNAKINLENNKTKIDQTNLSISNELYNYYTTYQNARSIFMLEKKAIEIAKLNLNSSENKYNQGLISTLQFREAQLALLNTEIKLANTYYSAMFNFYQLKRIAGEILLTSATKK